MRLPIASRPPSRCCPLSHRDVRKLSRRRHGASPPSKDTRRAGPRRTSEHIYIASLSCIAQ